jgi:hypothetical protein
MKLLNNPWVVGGLCLIAAAVVGYQFLPARGRTSVAPAPAASMPAPSLAAPAAPPASPAIPNVRAVSSTTTQAPAPVSLIERSYVQSHLAEWVASPRRDPFLFWVPSSKREAAAPSPVPQWSLKSIWHQTGSRLAVINNSIYAEGDRIGDYRLEAIESDRVWLEGPTGRESLSFTNHTPPIAAPPGTNAPGIK